MYNSYFDCGLSEPLAKVIFLSTFLWVDKLGAGLDRVQRVEAERSKSESVVICVL